MSLRCFVSSLVDFTPIDGYQRYISAVIDEDFKATNNKLVARGYASLRAALGENYTKDIILELSYSKDAMKWAVKVFWAYDWLDCEGMPMSQYDREKASGVCTLRTAEEKAIKCFQNEANEMLERLSYFYGDELKNALHIDD